MGAIAAHAQCNSDVNQQKTKWWTDAFISAAATRWSAEQASTFGSDSPACSVSVPAAATLNSHPAAVMVGAWLLLWTFLLAQIQNKYFCYQQFDHFNYFKISINVMIYFSNSVQTDVTSSDLSWPHLCISVSDRKQKRDSSPVIWGFYFLVALTEYWRKILKKVPKSSGNGWSWENSRIFQIFSWKTKSKYVIVFYGFNVDESKHSFGASSRLMCTRKQSVSSLIKSDNVQHFNLKTAKIQIE